MGLHIHLTVQLPSIDAAAWEATYEESLLLLRRFPSPLLRFEACEVSGHHRYRLTDEIIRDPGTEQERWEISGDRESGRRAESFCLSRHLHHYFRQQLSRKPNPEGFGVDVLWADEQDISYPEGMGTELFGNKTQGYPYHLALLAVGILLENRFPGRCFVHGQLDREPTEQVLAWVNAVLESDFKGPICLDGDALCTRLSGLFQDQEQLIQRFNTLFLGDQQEAMRTIIDHVEPDALKRHVAAELGHYDSLNQIGASRLLSTYLEVTQDIDGLIDRVLATPPFRAEPAASLETLLKVICRRFITISPVEREPLFALARPAGQLTTIDDAFDGVFRTLMGMPSAVQYHLRGKTLLERFVARKPELGERFREIIQAEEEACRKMLAKISTVQPKAAVDGEPANTVDASLEREEPDSHAEALLPGEDYLIYQIEQQRENMDIAKPKRIAEILGVAVGQMLLDYPQTFSAAEPEYYRKLIHWAGQTNQIVLWRGAWEEIDRESNIQILKVLAVLMLITERENSFCQCRTHILEHKSLWPYLMKSANQACLST
ncbi:hypothetical protein ACT3UM_08980 [Halomonas sp. AOP13-D3-9]